MNNSPDFDNSFYGKAPISRGFSSLRFMMRLLLKIIGVFAFSSALLAASFVSYDFIKTRKAFPPNSYIGMIEVSDLTQEEAEAKLKSFPLSRVFTPVITLESDTAGYPFAPSNIGIYLMYRQTVKNAFKLTRKENYLEELKERISKGSLSAPLVLAVDEDQLKVMLEALADKIRSSPKDASIIFYENTGGYNIESEELGRKLNIAKSIDVFKTNLYQGKHVIPLVINYTYPHVMEKELRAHPPVYRLSAYTTYYGQHDSPNRIHNIKLVASWINSTLMMPGDQFSVAESLGDVTSEQGFREAFVIVGGELVPLLGGGSCQIATTLYNTVSLADLKVLQRRNHTFYFNIYPLGRDAGVYPGQLDFRFENNTPFPVLIKAVATNRRLSFRIYGTPTGKTVKFSSVSILGRGKSGKFVPMTLKQVIAWDVPFKTSVTRTVYNEDGEKLEEETIKSSYKLYGDKTNVPIRRPEPR